MGNTQVTSLHAVAVGAGNDDEKVITNRAAPTVYYRSGLAVTSALNDGSLAETESVTVNKRTYLITAAQTDGEVSVTPAPVVIPGRRLIYQSSGILLEKAATAKVFFLNSETSVWTVESGALESTATETGLDNFFYGPTLFGIGDRSNSVTLDIVLLCNDTAPTSKFDFQLYKLEKSTAAEKKSTLTYEAAVPPKVTINAPAAKSITHEEASTPALTSGVYTIGLKITTESVAKSDEQIIASVYAT